MLIGFWLLGYSHLRNSSTNHFIFIAFTERNSSRTFMCKTRKNYIDWMQWMSGFSSYLWWSKEKNVFHIFLWRSFWIWLNDYLRLSATFIAIKSFLIYSWEFESSGFRRRADISNKQIFGFFRSSWKECVPFSNVQLLIAPHFIRLEKI